MLTRLFLMTALTVPMFAYGDDWRDGRDDGYYDRDRDYRYPRSRGPGYGNGNDRYGYGNGNYGYRDEGYGGYNNSGIINRVMRDLQVASSRNRGVNGHERDHFNRAMNELQQLNYRSQQGRVDNGRLNRVIEDLEHLSRANQVHPRDREMLARDMYDLQAFRSNRGGYNNRW
jgi:hypothetical protein